MSPTASPLGGFTQNRARFSPDAHSTQAPLGLLRRSSTLRMGKDVDREGDVPTDPIEDEGGLLRKRSSASTSTSKLLSRASSGLLGMSFNSQYDIDGQVDQVSSFMEQDVDFRAWVRDEDDDED